MLRSRAIGVVACFCLLALAAAVGEPAHGADPQPRLLVTADEFSYGLSRSAIDPGRAIVQLYNRGEDIHDLWIRRVGRTHRTSVPETLPGEVSEVERRLRSDARYKLWCSVADHKQLGMRAELRVRD